MQLSSFKSSVLALAGASALLLSTTPALAAGDDLAVRDEFRQSYDLSSGASVSVSGINGSVTVETGTGSTAEVHYVRSARTSEDLAYRKITIEQRGSTLVLKGGSDDDWRRSRTPEVRQRVELRLPRSVSLKVSGVAGSVTAGPIDGSIDVSGVNGSVRVEGASERAEVSGVNGSLDLTVANIGAGGVSISGINGSVDVRFASDVNADVSVSGVNGGIELGELGNVVAIGKITRSNVHARVGEGGAPISVSGVNGGVHLGRAGR